MFLTKSAVKSAVQEVLNDGESGVLKVKDLNKQIEKLEKELRDLRYQKADLVQRWYECVGSRCFFS